MSFINSLYAQYQEELADEMFTGDARRCPRHPHQKTSSDDGMFDCPCPECEAEMDDEAQQAFDEAQLRDAAAMDRLRAMVADAKIEYDSDPDSGARHAVWCKCADCSSRRRVQDDVDDDIIF